MRFFNILIIFCIYLLSSCSSKTPYIYDYECKRPDDIPEFFKDGTPVDWDCNWNSYYKEGLVTVIKDSAGNPIALARKTTGDDYIKKPKNGVEIEFKK